jgi:zinc transport system substrate-binding protein
MKAIKSMKLLQKFGLFLSTFYLLSIVSHANAETKVVASIKPLHSLISYVMDGVGTPDIIIDGSSSPHTFQLKPSHASMLQEADIVFWIGEDLEAFLESPLDSIAKNAKRVTLMDSNEINLLKFREKNIFDEHDDDEHGDDEHGDEHDSHAHGEYDIHFWLDPEIAKTIVKIVARELSEVDPANKLTYETNSKKALVSLDKLINETKSKINKDATYIVFHDAYQYFEQRFGIEVMGALTVNPEVLPGAKQLAEIREVIEHENVNCLFSEPQFNPNIADTIAKDTGIKTGILDPLGAELNPGKKLYFDLIENMASSLESC